jgi:hypothetical protein
MRICGSAICAWIGEIPKAPASKRSITRSEPWRSGSFARPRGYRLAAGSFGASTMSLWLSRLAGTVEGKHASAPNAKQTKTYSRSQIETPPGACAHSDQPRTRPDSPSFEVVEATDSEGHGDCNVGPKRGEIEMPQKGSVSSNNLSLTVCSYKTHQHR